MGESFRCHTHTDTRAGCRAAQALAYVVAGGPVMRDVRVWGGRLRAGYFPDLIRVPFLQAPSNLHTPGAAIAVEMA
jgi:hypothetical protein